MNRAAAVLLVVVAGTLFRVNAACQAQDLSRVVAPLEQGDAATAQAGLPDGPVQITDPALHERLVKLHQGPVFAQLGRQGQATVQYLEAATVADPQERLKALKQIADSLYGTYVSPLVRYDLGLLYLAESQLASAADNLKQAAAMGRWHQPKLAAEAVQRLAAIAAAHGEYRPEADLAARLLALPRFEAADLGLAGLCELQGRDVQGTSVPEPIHSGKAALRFQAAVANTGPDGFARFYLSLAHPTPADHLQFWVWPDQASPFAAAVIDADGTVVQRMVAPDQLQPRVWNVVSLDFAQHENAGTGDYVMDDVIGVSLVFTAPGGAAGDLPLSLVLDDFSLAGTGPVTLANAPVGGPRKAALAEVVADTDEITDWRGLSGGVVSADTATFHSGTGSLKLSVQFDPEGRGGGAASAIRPTGATWSASGLDFWCLPRDLARLNVILYDTQGTGITYPLAEDQLKVGQWCHLQLDFAKQLSFVGSRGSFGPIQVIHFVIGGAEPDVAFAGKGNCVWHFDDVHLTGQGPVKLAQQGDGMAGVTDPGGGGVWRSSGPLAVAVDEEMHRDQDSALRLTAALDPQVPNAGSAWYAPEPGNAGPAARLTFWCYPRDVAFLPVAVHDGQRNIVGTLLDERRLKVGQWSQITLEFSEMQNLGSGTGKLGAVSKVYFTPDPSWDRQHLYLKEKKEYVWYLSGLKLEGEGPVQLRPRAAGGIATATPGALTDIKTVGNWAAKTTALTVGFDNTVTHVENRSMRLSGVIDPAATNTAVVTYLPLAQVAGPAARFTFWCLPRDVAFLPVLIYDKDGDCVSKVLDEHDLKVGQWNEVTLDFAQMQDVGAGDGKLDAVACVYFAPDPGWDPKHEYLKEKKEYAWYLTGLQLQGEGPVQLQPREQQ